MSGLIGHRGAKSALVGDGGRVRVDALESSTTSQGTTSHVLDFAPKAGFSLGAVEPAIGYGWGIFSSTPVSTGSNNSIGNSCSGIRNITGTDWGRWEGPWISHNDSSPSNEGQLYRQTGGGSSYRWQYKVTAINTSGVDIFWQKIDSQGTCHQRTLMLR